MTSEHRHEIRLGMSILKIALKAAVVCAAFRMVNEIHKVHRAIENRESRK